MIELIRCDTEEGKQKLSKILSRSQLEHGNVQEIVDGILKDVKSRGRRSRFLSILKIR